MGSDDILDFELFKKLVDREAVPPGLVGEESEVASEAGCGAALPAEERREGQGSADGFLSAKARLAPHLLLSEVSVGDCGGSVFAGGSVFGDGAQDGFGPAGA